MFFQLVQKVQVYCINTAEQEKNGTDKGYSMNSALCTAGIILMQLTPKIGKKKEKKEKEK